MKVLLFRRYVSWFSRYSVDLFVVGTGKYWVSFESFIGTKAIHLLQSNFYLVAEATAADAAARTVAVVAAVNSVTIFIVYAS